MLKFPHIPIRREPLPKRISAEEYTSFCLFCLENNPKSLQQAGNHVRCVRRTGKPFRLSP